MPGPVLGAGRQTGILQYCMINILKKKKKKNFLEVSLRSFNPDLRYEKNIAKKLTLSKNVSNERWQRWLKRKL